MTIQTILSECPRGGHPRDHESQGRDLRGLPPVSGGEPFRR